MVSIIIPCYNYGKFLDETLRNLTAQTYVYWECLIVDDGSTDNTREVAEHHAKLDKRFRYIRQSNNGVSSARSNGYSQAKGDYIQFLDADDYIAFEKLERQVSFLDSNRNIDIIYGSVLYFDSDKPKDFRQSLDYSFQPWMPNTSGRGIEIVKALMKSNIMVIQAPLLRKISLDKIDITNSHLRYNEDWYLWIQCALANMCFFYSDDTNVLSYVRVHKASASQNRIKMTSGEIEMRSLVHNRLMQANLLEAMKINLKKIGDLYQSLGWFLFENANYLNSFKCFWKSAKATGDYFTNSRYVLGLIKKILFNKA